MAGLIFSLWVLVMPVSIFTAFVVVMLFVISMTMEHVNANAHK